jgi:transposase
MKYIGMDAHKTTIMVGIVDGRNHSLPPFPVATTPEDVRRLARAIKKPARVALEATRNHAYLHDLLESEGLDVFVSHPKDTDAIGKSKKKSDRHDAITLAKLLKADVLTESYVPPLDVRLLRELVRDYRRLVAISTRAKNWIRATLAQEGLTCRFSDIFGKNARSWLSSVALHPMRKASIERSLAIIAAAQDQIRGAAKRIVDLVRDDPDIRLLMSIPGVGYIIAAAILSEIGDIFRFSSDRKLASYSGLVTTTRESGGVIRYGHITKEGPTTLRWALVAATAHLIRRPGPLKSFYERLAEKHGKKSARAAAARKLLRYIYAILTSRKEYDPGMAVQRGIECVLGQPPVRVGQARRRT